MPDNNDLAARRREAELAMGGDKLVEKEKRDEKRRREAVLAMEGEEHRKLREAKETAERSKIAKAQVEAEAKARSAAETQAATARAAAEKSRKEEAAINAEVNRRDKIGQSQSLTDKLKTTATKLNPLRTIKTDMARAVKEEGLSLSKIATLSQQREHSEESIVSNEGSKFWLVFSIVIILAASGTLAGWWWLGRPTVIVTPSNNIPPVLTSILQADTNRPMNLAGLNTVSQVRDALELAVETNNEQRGIINIYFTKNTEILPFFDFRQAFDLKLPDDLTRYVRDNFFFGILDNGETKSRFLIIETSFFAQAWSAMLNWERYMSSDLGPLLKTIDDSRATWSDKVVSNKDTRIERGPNGNTILIYGFINEETIVIARDEATFTAVFERLINQT